MAPNLANRFFADRQGIVAFDPLCSPGGQLAFQVQGFLSLRRRDPAEGVFGSPALVLEALQRSGGPAFEPFADGFGRGIKLPGRGLNTLLFGPAGHFEPEVLGIFTSSFYHVIWNWAHRSRAPVWFSRIYSMPKESGCVHLRGGRCSGSNKGILSPLPKVLSPPSPNHLHSL